jgi:DNA-directed RNA polymerase subunit RPC12/RpoP
MKDIDTNCTDEVVCPHCGHEYSHSEDFFWHLDQSAEIECEECSSKFEATRDFSVTYYSRKIEKETP